MQQFCMYIYKVCVCVTSFTSIQQVMWKLSTYIEIRERSGGYKIPNIC